MSVLTNFRCWLLVILGLAIFGALDSVAAEDRTDQANTIRYRRLHVPEREVGRLLPRNYQLLERAEFEQLLEQLEAMGQDGRRGAEAVVREADYYARLDNDTLLDGLAVLDVQTSSSVRTRLWLDQFAMAIGPAEWQGDEPREAALGRDGAGRLVLPMEGAGRVMFPWTLRGQRNGLSEITFRFSAPRATVQRLVLDLPRGVAPLAGSGVVTAGEDEVSPLLQPHLPERDEEHQRWVITLNGAGEALLRVVPESTIQTGHRVVLLRNQHVQYELTPRGLNLTVDLNLDIYYEPLQGLRFELDPGLQLMAARWAGQSVPWSVEEVEDSPVRQATLHFPTPVSGTNRKLRLTAIMPLVLDQPWQLPLVHMPEMAWQQGRVTLEIPDSLELAYFDVQEGRETGVEPLPNDGQQRHVELFSPTPQMTVVLNSRQPVPEIASATAISFSAESMAANCVVDVHSRWGSVFEVSAHMPREWFFDSLQPLTDDYDVESDVQLVDDQTQMLRVRFDPPLAPRESVRFRVRAHRETPAHSETSPSPFDMSHLRMLRFADGDNHDQLVALTAETGFQIRPVRDHRLDRLQPEDLAAALRDLLPSETPDLLFRDSDALTELGFVLTREHTLFSGELHLSVQADESKVVESYEIVCSPQSSPMRRLLVHLSPARGQDLRWQGDNGQRNFSARRLHRMPETQAVLEDGEIWEIVFQEPQTRPFTLTAVRESTFTDDMRLALASLPEADSQTGRLTISSVPRGIFEVVSEDLVSIPAESGDPRAVTRSDGNYRYEPSKNIRVHLSTNRQGGIVHTAWIWLAEITSRFATAGEAKHTATFYLENWGRDELRVQLAADCRIEDVRIDGRSIAIEKRTPDHKEVLVPLPATRRFLTVQVEYRTAPGPLRDGARVSCPLPQCDIPVLETSWKRWLPSGLVAADALQSPGRQESWFERAFALLDSTGWPPHDTAGAGRVGKASDTPPLTEAQGLRQSRQLLERLEAKRAERPAGEDEPAEITWSQLLGMAVSEDQLPLWIDYVELARAGVAPSTPISLVSNEGEGSLLAQHHLVLIVHDEAYVLTGEDYVMRHAGSFATLDDYGLVYVPRDDRWKRKGALAGHPTARYLDLETWSTAPVLPMVPWSVAALAGADRAADRNWTRSQRSLGTAEQEAGAAHMRLVHRPTRQAYGWAALLITTALGWWSGRLRRQMLVILLALAVLAVAFVSPAWLPLASGMLLGGLLATLLVGLSRQRTSAPLVVEAEPSISTATAMALRSVVLTAGVAASWTVATAHAEQANDPKPRPPEYHVVVPIDDQMQPTGKHVWLPMPMYDQLLRHTAHFEPDGESFLLRAAQYYAELDWNSDQEELSLLTFTANYRVETFASDTRLTLPFRREEVQVVAALVDGVSSSFQWDRHANALSLDVTGIGEHDVDLVLRPRLQTESNIASLEIEVPPLPQAELTVTAPPDAMPLQFPTARGMVEERTDVGETKVQLGAASRVRIEWPRSASREGTEGLSADQYLWLTFRPGAVIVEGQFTFRTSGPPISSVRLVADSRLQMLYPDENQPVASHAIHEGEPRIIEFRLDEPHEEEVSLRARFFMSLDGGSVGDFRLPHLQPVAEEIPRRWIALSLPPELVAEPPSSDALEPLAREEFLSAWEQSAEPPHLAYRVVRQHQLWTLPIRPREIEQHAEEWLNVSAGADSCELEYQLQLSSPEAERYQIRLRVPPDFVVHSASVHSGDILQRVTPKLDGAGHLSIFFSDRRRGPLTLQLAGELPVQREQWIDFPRITVDGTQHVTSHVRLYRPPEVKLQTRQSEGKEAPASVEAAGYHANLGRLVDAYQISDAQAARDVKLPQLQVHANTPRLQARTITELSRQDDQWFASFEYLVHIADGTVDQLRLEAPAQWEEVTLVNASEVELTSRELPTPTRRQLLIRPSQPVTGEFRVRLRGTLPTVDAARVPHIFPLDIEQVDQYIVLPTELQREQIEWETSGLRETNALPDDYSFSDDPQIGPYAAFEAVAGRYQAKVKHVERVLGIPQVRLADISLRWAETDRRAFGVATFDVEPAGLDDCLLEIPEGCEVISVAVGGIPMPVVEEDRKARIRLASPALPQRVEVVFSGQVNIDGHWRRTSRFNAPMIVDLPVQRTLWTVISDDGYRGRPLLEQSEVTQTRQELFRLEAIDSLLDMSADVAAESGSRELEHWYRRWMRRLVRSQARLVHSAAGSQTNVDRDPNEVMLAVQERQSALAQRLRLSETQREIWEESPYLATVEDALLTTVSDPSLSTSATFLDATGELWLEYPPAAPAEGLLQRLAMIGLLLLMGLVVWRLRLISFLGEAAALWPHAFGVLLGLGWALWFTPAWLGWALVALSSLAALPLPTASHLLPKTERGK